MRPFRTATGTFLNPSNRFGVDYRAEAASFGPPPVRVVDAHSHVHGSAAAALLREAMDAYGIAEIHSMTRLEEIPAVRSVLGDRVRFIAVPDFASPDRIHAHGRQFLERIKEFRREGAAVCKFWAAPRGIDFGAEAGDPRLLALDAPHRLAAMDEAASLGMAFMAHVADPDTWFATKYSNPAVYGMKRDHYPPLERMIDRFSGPWLAAHMGGWPEDLDFLDGLLTRHPNLSLDTSATKWVVRELSSHPRGRVFDFFSKWQGRILFGSDIVTIDDHLTPKPAEMLNKHPMADLADSPEAAFDLYASRYLALRLMFETDYTGESPIADPDLKMVNPALTETLPAPRLQGLNLPPNMLRVLYREACEHLLGGPPLRGGRTP